jgi:hypothetical protein
MSLNGTGPETSEQHRIQVSRWLIRLLIALVVSAIIIFFFFTSGAISR